MPLNKDRLDNIDTNLDSDKKNLFINKILNKFRGGNKRNSGSPDKGLDRETSIFDLVPDGIIVINLAGFIVATNQAYHTLTGYSMDEVVGKHVLQVPAIQIDEKNDYWTQIKALFGGKGIQSLEFRYLHADGSMKWGEARVRMGTKGLFRGGAIAVLRDITERKQKDEELKRLLADLERSNRELDDYTFAVSHDLKAPLRTIESFSSFLLEDHSDNLDDEGKEYLQRMILATKRMNTLIQDLLLISRVGRLNSEIDLVDLYELISDIVDDMELILNERNGEMIYTKLPSIKTQKVWIKQVFSNLISNGLKFNESPNPRIWIKCEERKDHYILSVKDNGIGIDKKHHNKIFKIFQRLHTVNEYPGTGAGLTMCKKIVESMGGNISLDSKLGKGSTFYITIPKGSEISEESEPPYQSDDALLLVHENTNSEH